MIAVVGFARDPRRPRILSVAGRRRHPCVTGTPHLIRPASGFRPSDSQSADSIAFLSLELAILTHDFTIAYVAKNTAIATPFVFLLAAGWAALEGSVVLWGLMLSVFTWLVWRGRQERATASASSPSP